MEQIRYPEDVLRWGFAEFGPRFAIVTSFQREGMVLVDMASRIGAGVRVLTLNTGRLPEETLRMVESLEDVRDIAQLPASMTRSAAGQNMVQA